MLFGLQSEFCEVGFPPFQPNKVGIINNFDITEYCNISYQKHTEQKFHIICTDAFHCFACTLLNYIYSDAIKKQKIKYNDIHLL